MVCGGFACSRNALCALNVVYMLVGLLLIAVAAWGKGFGIVDSLHIIGGVIAVGFFLLLIAIVGLIGAINHHQVMLFFYMIILGLVFIFQFGVSCSCLGLPRNKQESLLNNTWKIMENGTRRSLEKNLDCCGLFNNTIDSVMFKNDTALCYAGAIQTNLWCWCNCWCNCVGCHKDAVKCIGGTRRVSGCSKHALQHLCDTLCSYTSSYTSTICKSSKSPCRACGDKMMEHAGEALKILGGVGLFFSFTEILGVWLAMRYRNQKDPRANPSAFL